VRVSVRVQVEPFDPCAVQLEVRRGNAAVGAVVSFVGVMRDVSDGQKIDALILEHYPGMTEKALSSIAVEAGERWPLHAVTIIHRVGELRPEDPIVLVVVASAHRGEAFQACEFVIDYLKTRAPFWKKEKTAGGGRWVEAKASDDVAGDRWK